MKVCLSNTDFGKKGCWKKPLTENKQKKNATRIYTQNKEMMLNV